MTILRNRYFRRLLFVVIILAAIDQAVPAILATLEERQYESSRTARFENSDLLTIVPVLQYLADHPVGRQKRVAFIGASVVWGYGLRDVDAIPAQFQARCPNVKVFNFGANGIEAMETYLITSRILDSVDAIYVFPNSWGDEEGPLLPRPSALGSALRVRDAEAAASDLSYLQPSLVQRTLERVLDRWKLYASSYRLQNALWGTSTRQFLYNYKSRLAQMALGRVAGLHDPQVPNAADERFIETWQPPAAIKSPVADSLERIPLTTRHPWLLKYATLAADHRKKVVIISIERLVSTLGEKDIDTLNQMFAPYVSFIRMPYTRELTLDGSHYTAGGAAVFATMLQRLTAQDLCAAAPRNDDK